MNKKIIYSTEVDYEGANEYIEGEIEEVKATLEKLAEKSWLGNVLAETCDKKIEELKIEEAYNSNSFWRDCESDNLSQETGEIIVIGDLGLWNGRKQGVKETGKYNLNVILENHGDIDDYEVYVEGGEVKATGYHHDGTNYYIFREVIDTEKWEKLRDKIIAGEEYTVEDLNSATKSLAERVKEIYGW